MNAQSLVKRLLEADEFDPSAEVDRIMGPITMEQFRAWLDEVGLTNYTIDTRNWIQAGSWAEANGKTSGYFPEVSEKVNRVVERIGAQGSPYYQTMDSRPEQDILRDWQIGFSRQYLQESEDDDFDPTEEIDRLVAPLEIYADENVKVFIPRTFETFLQANGGSVCIQVPNPKDKAMPLTIARSEAFHAATKAYGPFYVAQDFKRPLKGDLPPGLVMNFNLGKVWKSPENQEVQWKDVVNMFSAEALASLQKGLGDYFMKEAKQPGKTRLAVAALTRLGRYDDAAKFGRHAARMDVPFGQSMAVALSRQQQKLRTNNRFTRLIGSMGDVAWKKRGCYLLVDDWSDLVVFFDKGSRDFVEKVLNSDLEFYDSGISVKDAFDWASKGNQQLMKQLLIGRHVETDDYTPPITAEDAASMTERELRDILTSDENEDEVDDIRNAIRWAADDAERDAYETAYWSLIKDKINDAFGGEKGKEHGEFVKHGGKDKLAIYVPYTQLEEWLKNWREDHYNEEWDGSLFDLAREYVESIDVDTRHVNTDFSSDYFNEQLKHHLSEIDMQPYPDKSDPNQPELFTDDERIEAPDAEAAATVSVHPPEGEEGVPSVYKHVRDTEAGKYQKALGDKRVHWHHESRGIVATLLEDDVDPNEFIDQHMSGKDFLVRVTYEDMPGHTGYVIGTPGYYGVSFDAMAYENATDMDFKTASQMAQHVMWNESSRGAKAEVVQAK